MTDSTTDKQPLFPALADMKKRLVITFRVVFALVLREARVRHGRSRLGYTWAIVEPVLLITILTILFSQFREGRGPDFAIFFACGVLSFTMFRGSSTYISSSFDSNKPLFNYPMVKPMDTAIARLVLDSSTHAVVIFLIFTFQILIFRVDAPSNIPVMIMAAGLLLLMAFGAGVSLAVLRRFFPTVANLYAIIMGPAFFVSAIFYSVNDIPSQYKGLLLLNPIVHGVELFRSGYYPVYRMDGVSPFYLFSWGVVLTTLGLIGEWLTRFRQR